MDDNSKFTRREFFRLAGSGVVGVVGGMIFGRMYNNFGDIAQNNNYALKNLAYADTLGSWSLGANMSKTPIHATLLPTGWIIYLTGSDYAPTQQKGPYWVGLFDPDTGIQKSDTVPHDVFCCGHCLLPNGNLLLTGGTLAYAQNTPNGRWWGGNWVYEYDIALNSFVQVTSMAHGRWYPTPVALPNGTVAVVSGYDEFGCTNGLMEIYDPHSQSFSIKYDPLTNLMYCVGACTTLPGAGSPCYGGTDHGTVPPMSYYPRMHIMPNGLLACVGMNQPLKTWNPSTGHWISGGQFATGKNRVYGTSVLLPLKNSTTETGSILSIGGAPDFASPATNQSEIVTPNGNSLQTHSTTSMKYPRLYLNATILPTGSIFVNGGTTQADLISNSVYAAEMFDPITQKWTTLPSAKVARRYHSVSLLLKDGRVWTAGTTIGQNPPGELRTEIFSPSYLFVARPIITGLPIIRGGYGGSITIPTPNATSISSVSLVKISSVTHHYSSDQRLVWLQIQRSDLNSVTVAAPINANIAPPGYYLIHILDEKRIPSTGQFIKIPM